MASRCFAQVSKTVSECWQPCPCSWSSMTESFRSLWEVHLESAACAGISMDGFMANVEGEGWRRSRVEWLNAPLWVIMNYNREHISSPRRFSHPRRGQHSRSRLSSFTGLIKQWKWNSEV